MMNHHEAEWLYEFERERVERIARNHWKVAAGGKESEGSAVDRAWRRFGAAAAGLAFAGAGAAALAWGLVWK
ncbi:hypothetical protein [Paenibacillus flagellatus]|uniref:Uncharacterized protein n=1 Tax=Paenibacillus flagellatus TaxID=2211139 RepID=A0A2V5K2K1_9BACL|nr:hypothetical protein [Paenibacillus flagellatus]PYI52842.1 hypothetical protein DLM86_17685 [Paenibacillus flagellatus]